jgi:hypothetical protein
MTGLDIQKWRNFHAFLKCLFKKMSKNLLTSGTKLAKAFLFGYSCKMFANYVIVLLLLIGILQVSSARSKELAESLESRNETATGRKFY